MLVGKERMQIKLLKHQEIDFDRWDFTISNARNTLPYAYSAFLNLVSPSWEALITEDYKFLMPLPVKKFFFVKYVAQPPFCQQLGIFSEDDIEQEILKKFLDKVPYPILSYNFNEWIFVNDARKNPNYVLDLSHSKEELFNRFSKNTWRNIAKAKKCNLTFDAELSNKDFFDFFRKNDNKIGLRFEKQMSVFRGRCYGVRNSWGKLVAAVFCLQTKDRLIYLAPVSSEEGKNSSAMFLLVYRLIDMYSDIILDFEGSRIEGIARFYKGFGAEQRTYYTIGYAK